MSAQITVKLPDGSSREYASGTTAAEVAASIGKGLAKAAIAAKADGEWIDLGRPLDHDVALQIVVPESDDGREVLRHSTAHVMAEAVTHLFPGAKVAIGPAIADGFYYDFDLPNGETFSDDDLGRIEAEMRAIVQANQRFERTELSYDDALALFADQPYKREIIEKVRSGAADDEDAGEAGGDGAGVSVYRNVVNGADGKPEVEFTDLCRGPHVPSTGKLGVFKLQKVAGAYWRGNEKGPMLQRIYGTAWESKAALAEYLHRLEEAERRDHRKLGVELDLFSFPEEIGSGLAVFHPKGARVRRIMEEYSRERHEAAGYEFVNSPHITKSKLFEISGHLDWFAEAMFPPLHLDEGGQNNEGTDYYLKPMNCPFHILIFNHRTRSYRELPLRMFEFGTVYRYEKSGVVHGLTRVRGMTQDDAHIFCTKEQMAAELSSLLDFVLDVLRDYGLTDFYLELSTKPEGKAVGRDDEWEEATEALRAVAMSKNLDLVLDEGGGAFYGPKISVQAKDAIGRTWQMSTIQVDFQLPQRFGMEYTGADNERHQPIMIHRALFGTIERFFAILLEHYAGAFPAWLAPVQVTVLPVSDRNDPYGFRVVDRLKAEGFRAEMIDGSAGSLGARIRKAKTDKVPYILVVGDTDAENGTVGVNARGSNEPERDVKLDAFEERLAAVVLEHR
jgi:threonyl-tRNA synthetase